MKTNKTQEQLYNRILINFGIGILAYSLLYFLYQHLYMKNWVTFTIAGVFFALAILFFVLSKKKPTKNYGYMFVAFGGALLFTRLSVIVASVIGFNNFISLLDIYWLKKLLQTDIQVRIIVICGAVYLVGMLVYNSILMYKAGKREKEDRKKIKH